MASPAYMTIYDDKGQVIPAHVKIAGREGTAEVHAFDYYVAIPSDPNSGVLTAIRKHGDVVVVKQYDQSSPVLFNACCRGLTLKKITIDWYRINDQGEEEKYFSHTLSDVKVVRVQHLLPQVKDDKNDLLGHQEAISLRFRRIDVNYPQGNIQATDDWLASRSAA